MSFVFSENRPNRKRHYVLKFLFWSVICWPCTDNWFNWASASIFFAEYQKIPKFHKMESQYAPLSEACAKTLWDKTYDKRKLAATEIEKQVLSISRQSDWRKLMILLLFWHRMVIEFNTTKNYVQIRKLINVLGQDLATSRDNNKRKGGLLGLAATCIGLGRVRQTWTRAIECPNFSTVSSFIPQDTDKFVEELVTPVLNCLADPEVLSAAPVLITAALLSIIRLKFPLNRSLHAFRYACDTLPVNRYSTSWKWHEAQ